MNTATPTTHTDTTLKENSSKNTTKRVASSAHGLIDDAATKAEEVEAKLRVKAHQAGQKIEASQEAAMEQFEHSLEKVELFVKRRPMTAAGIAFAAGVLASSLLRR